MLLKIYFWAVLVTVLLSYLLEASNLTFIDWAGLVALGAGFVGLYGYVFAKNVGSRKHWKVIFFAATGFYYAYILILDKYFGGVPSTTIPEYLVGLVSAIPAFWATYRYAFQPTAARAKKTAK